MLDALREKPEWSDAERGDLLDRLVERFSADDLVEAVQARLVDLSGGDAQVMLRLVESFPRPGLLRALAEAVDAQPDLALERAWEALSVLDGAGLLEEYPALAERWEELEEALDDVGSAEQLIEHLEEDPEGIWLALQGLAAVERDIRPEIVAGLGRGNMGPGLVEFLRILAYSYDPATRGIAVGMLTAEDAANEPGRLRALVDLAQHHPDAAVAGAVRRRIAEIGSRSGEAGSETRLDHPAPRIVRSLVSAIDGRGRASIALAAVRGAQRVTSAFLCDIETGVREVFGDVSPESSDADATFDEFAGRVDCEVIDGAHALALGLLSGCLTLCAPDTPPALRYWIEATAGPELRPQPFPAEFPGWDPIQIPSGEMPRRAEAILDACPGWIDASALTYELAEEIQLREGNVQPNSRRDEGAYRFLFEHRLRRQLERYRRMLLWMAWFWRSSGDEDLGRSALALAWQLSDAQHVVPGHPFTVALATRSLAGAQADLKRGIDPRGRRDR
jgi:hypothetical protein